MRNADLFTIIAQKERITTLARQCALRRGHCQKNAGLDLRLWSSHPDSGLSNSTRPPSARPRKPSSLVRTPPRQFHARGKANWGGLLNAAIRTAKVRAKSRADFKELITMNFAKGQSRVRTTASSPIYQPIGAGSGCEVRVEEALATLRSNSAASSSRPLPSATKKAAFPGITGQFNIGGRS
jgi:hypothetical protein